MATLTLTLNYPAIKQAVKSDTYITGQIDKSADMVKNAALAFNEQAGDESYHEAKIFRTVKGALAKFEAAIAEYVETSNASATISDSLTSTSSGDFTITATINNRTSNAFQAPLAYLAQEFVINTALYYWWQPIKPALAKDYLAFSMDNLNDVRRCLAKSAPSASSASYANISGSVTVPPVVMTYHPDHYVNEDADVDDDGYLVPVSDIQNNIRSGSSVNFSVGASRTLTLYAVSSDLLTYDDSDLSTVSSGHNLDEHSQNTIERMDNNEYVLVIPSGTPTPDTLTITITQS